MTIRIYTKPNCKYCNMVKKVLNENTVGYSEIDLSVDENLVEFKKNYPGIKSVPFGTKTDGTPLGTGDYYSILSEVTKLKGDDNDV